MRKSPLTVAVSIAMLSCVNAHAFSDGDVKVIRSISLVNKSAEQIQQGSANTATSYQRKQVGQSSLFHNDIVRQLNSYPGMFAARSIVNGQNPSIVYNSAPSQGAVMVVQDGHSSRPLPYLDRSLLSFSGVNRRTQILDKPEITSLPSGLVGGIARDTGSIEERRTLEVAIGSDSQADVGLEYGHQQGEWGHLFQFSHQQIDSYREAKHSLDNGMKANDILIKIAEKGNNLGSVNQQQTEFTVQYSDYENNESRFGIAEQDIDSHPTLRYSATALDNEATEKLSFDLNHEVILASGEVIDTDVYYNDGEASFYQTASVNGLEGAAAANLLSDFERGPASTAQISKDAFTRDYASGGIKVTIKESFGEHNASLGVNYHTETVNDSYYSDLYQLNSDLSLSLVNGDIDARQSSTRLNSRSVFLTDQWRRGALTVDMALKHEWINRERTQDDTDERTVSESTHTLGSVTVDYQLSNSINLFISGQEGLLPSNNWLTPSLPQTSQNVRGGISYQDGDTAFSLVGFNNDFYNVFSRCFTIAQCSALDDERNDINVRGLELTASYVVALDGASVPLSFSYTYRDHEYAGGLDEVNASTNASIGDELAFLPKQQAFAQIGYQNEHWNVAMRASYRAAQRHYAGSLDIETVDSIDDLVLVDLSASYQLDNQQKLTATLNNLTDEHYVESAFNGTNLMGKERSVVIGYSVKF